MRNLIYTLVLIICATAGVMAQCNEYYQFGEGNEWEFQTFNAKGKLTGKNHQKVTKFEKTSDGFVAAVKSTFYSDKEKETMSGDLEFRCEGGTMYIDMRNFISDEQLKAFGEQELAVDSENLEIPSNLSVGQTLKDGSVKVTASGSGIPMAITVDITNRKVVGKESITTPAGTYECFKITSSVATVTQMGIKMNVNISSIDWITSKLGVIKSESYNKNDKLMGYTVLSSWK